MDAKQTLRTLARSPWHVATVSLCLGIGVAVRLAAFLLAVAGVYSVVAFFVSLRTHEFGICLAVGAQPKDITRMVVMQSSRLVLGGLLAGLVLGMPVLIFLAKAFPYPSAFDPLGLGGPNRHARADRTGGRGDPPRQAARVDPCTALRSE